MKAIELIGHVDEEQRLHAHVPEGFGVGPVRLIVLFADAASAGLAWTQWAAELSDARQDIYTLDDGQPLNLPQ